MAYELDAFCKDCREALKSQAQPEALETIRVNLERLLGNEAFVAAHLGPDAEVGRETLYEDPELDFCVLAHINRGARVSPPHDHGASWAIYGQATLYTDMTVWRRTDGGQGTGAATVEAIDTYRLTPGHAGIYGVGAIHSIDYPETARFVRVTG
nr:hypothetical protein [Gammaproteobacteria bacterium]